VQVACNDDAGAANRWSQAQFELTGGVPYFVFVQGYDSSIVGEYSLHVRFGPCNVLPSPEVCDDHVDNDQDGGTDCADLDCLDAPSCAPAPEVCDDQFDNDRDSLTDCADPDCAADRACVSLPEVCDDGYDNDHNGDLDCFDAACVGAPACQEICNDGLDNDLDTLIDCADVDCAETPGCIAGGGTCASPYHIRGAGTYGGDLMDSESQLEPGCRASYGAREDVWLLQTTRTTSVCIDSGGDDNKVLYAHQAACVAGEEVACDATLRQIEFVATADVPYFVVVDGYNAGPTWERAYRIHVRFGPCATSPTAEVCDNSVDDGQDGLEDCDDPDCVVDAACLQGSVSCGDPFVPTGTGSVSGDIGAGPPRTRGAAVGPALSRCGRSRRPRTVSTASTHAGRPSMRSSTLGRRTAAPGQRSHATTTAQVCRRRSSLR